MAVYDLSITDGLLSTTRAVRKRLDFERPWVTAPKLKAGAGHQGMLAA